MIKMIVAVDNDNAIGWKDGRLPWKISADLKRFKSLTEGHAVLMGYRTFLSLKRPNGLPNRQNFVATTSHVKEVKNAVTSLTGWVSAIKDTDLWVIGGATIYDQLLRERLIDEIFLTRVNAHSGADVQLSFNMADPPKFIRAQARIGVKWYLDQEETSLLSEDGTEFCFVTLRKIK